MPEHDPTATVSVVIPAYNIAPYLARALDSVLAQTRPADEIIVVDDGSTDDTAAVAARYRSTVRYLRQPNAGLSAARNTGIRAARCRWIALLDGDDCWLPQKLEKQLALLGRRPELVWCGTSHIVHDCRTGREHPVRPVEHLRAGLDDGETAGDFFRFFGRWTWLAPCTMIIRRDVFDAVGPFDERQRFAEDLDMWFRIAYRWPTFGYLVEPLAVYYRNRPGSLVTATPPDEQLRVFCEQIYDRHLQLSSRAGHGASFQTYLTWQCRTWIRTAYDEGRFAAIRYLLRRYGKYYPPGYRYAMQFLAALPPLRPLVLAAARWRARLAPARRVAPKVTGIGSK